MFAIDAHRTARRALLACCLLLALAATSASARLPKHTAVATVSSPSSGECTTTATLNWNGGLRRQWGAIVTFWVDNGLAGDEFVSLEGIRGGAVTAESSPTIAVGQTFVFDAQFAPYFDTATSGQVTC